MKVKIIKDFKDKKTGKLYKAGTTADFNKSRVKEIEDTQEKIGYLLIRKDNTKEDTNE